MAITTSVISTKGSVGKTALIIQLAGYLSSLKKSVLLIDADSQQSLSAFFDYKGIDPEINKNGFGQFLIGKKSASEVIHKTSNSEYIDVIVNDDPQKWLVSDYLKRQVGSVYKLAQLIRPLKSQYDYIFIDTEGTDGRDHGGYSVQNAVLLAEPDMVLSVTKTKLQFAMEAMRVVDVYKDAISAYQSIENYEIKPPLKFVINEHDRQSSIATHLLRELQDEFAFNEGFKDAILLDTIIPLKRKFFDNLYHNKGFAHDYNDTNKHDKLPAVIEALAHELFPNLNSGG